MLSKIESSKLVKGLRLDMPNDWEKIIEKNMEKYDIEKEDVPKIKKILEIKLNHEEGSILDDYKSLFIVLPGLFIPIFVMLKDYLKINVDLIDKIIDYKNKESVENLRNLIAEANKEVIDMFFGFIMYFIAANIILILLRYLYVIYKQKSKERIEILLYFIENQMEENK